MISQPVMLTAKFKLHIDGDNQLDELFLEYREMVNELLSYCVERGITSYMRLTNEKYHDIRRKYPNLPAQYVVTASRMACSIYKSFRKRKRKGKARADRPYFKKSVILLHKNLFGLDLNKWELLLSAGRRYRRIGIKLMHGTYHEKFRHMVQREAYLIKRDRSYYLHVFFLKSPDVKDPDGKAIAVDVNENNVTFGSNERVEQVITGERAIRTAYFLKRKRIYKKLNLGYYFQNGKLIHLGARKLLAKYRGRQKERVNDLYHKVANKIIKTAKEEGVSAIVMERLKHLQRGWRRQKNLKNKKRKISKALRGRLNRWSFRKLQEIIEYKAKLAGLNVIYVNPRGTSSLCPICGVRLSPNGHRLMRCPKCGLEEDRDVIAVKNLLLKLRDVGASSVHPEGLPDEMRGESEKLERTRRVVRKPVGDDICSQGG